MTIIKNERFGEERALYASRDIALEGCRFEGAEDGESALKESSRIRARGCHFALRYPLWHTGEAWLEDCDMTENCRAAIWYGNEISLHGCRLFGVKALREASGVKISDCKIRSTEFGWFCSQIEIENSEIEAEYLFLRSSGITARGMDMRGKYSFQYISDSTLDDCRLNTKDAFWHSKNVTLRNCELTGEYLGWYSEGLTLYNCKITGTQPFCYCKNLRLINCEMNGCDLSFEKSSVDAEVTSVITSVKNPESGRIAAKGYGEIIIDTDDSHCEITTVT